MASHVSRDVQEPDLSLGLVMDAIGDSELRHRLLLRHTDGYRAIAVHHEATAPQEADPKCNRLVS